MVVYVINADPFKQIALQNFNLLTYDMKIDLIRLLIYFRVLYDQTCTLSFETPGSRLYLTIFRQNSDK